MKCVSSSFNRHLRFGTFAELIGREGRGKEKWERRKEKGERRKEKGERREGRGYYCVESRE